MIATRLIAVCDYVSDQVHPASARTKGLAIWRHPGYLAGMERTHVAVQQLVDRIDRGELKLPEIQRGYVWKPTQVATLIDSLYRRYPSGSMLLWRPTEDVLGRDTSIESSGMAPVSRPQYLLDGQQRLTSLHRVFKRHPEAQVVFNVDEERCQIQSAATAKDRRWVRVVDVIEADKLSALRRSICEAVPDLDEDDVDERLGRLRAIAKYEYYLEILTELTYRDVADIFVRVNSKGRALKTVDLTLAVLSAEWPGIVAKIDEQTERWTAAGWPKIDATFLVRALAATATDAGTLSRLAATDIASLEAGWARVKHGTEFLVRLLGENAGIKTSNLIPSMNALVPLVVLLGRYDKDQEFTDSDAIIYWLLSVFVTSRYSAAADTKIAQDSLAARSDEPVRRMFETAGLMGSPLAISEQQLVGKGAGSPFFLLSYLAAKRRKAKDWWYDVEISETSAGSPFSIEYHHIHPQATLRNHYAKSEINDLANLAFISATANKKISDRPPRAYFPELLDGRDDLSPHLVPLAPELRDPEQFRGFLIQRRRKLASAMTELLEERRPSWIVEAQAPSEGEPAEFVSLTLTGDADPELVFEARRGESAWIAAAPLADVERFLADASDGLASSLQLGPEIALVDPGAEDLTVPVGPFYVVGSLVDWQVVINREKSDPQPTIVSPSDAGRTAPFDGERRPFPVLDTD